MRTGGNAYTQTYRYDASGNRTKKTLGGVDTTYLYNTGDQVTSETTGGTTTEYLYDANGALTKSHDCTAGQDSLLHLRRTPIAGNRGHPT